MSNGNQEYTIEEVEMVKESALHRLQPPVVEDQWWSNNLVLGMANHILRLESERRWIPVSERLPTETNDYSVAKEGGEEPEIECFFTTSQSWTGENDDVVMFWKELDAMP